MSRSKEEMMETEMSDRRRNQILQTVIIRIERGMRGAPESYSEEEKAYYLGLEEEILRNKEKGIRANYSICCDCDW